MPVGCATNCRSLLLTSSVLLAFVLAFSRTLAQKPHQVRCVRYSLTVAGIDTGKNAQYTVVTFYQSQRFYKLLKHSVKYRAYFQLLRHSQKAKTPVCVYRRTEYSDTIIRVAAVRAKR